MEATIEERLAAMESRVAELEGAVRWLSGALEMTANLNRLTSEEPKHTPADAAMVLEHTSREEALEATRGLAGPLLRMALGAMPQEGRHAMMGLSLPDAMEAVFTAVKSAAPGASGAGMQTFVDLARKHGFTWADVGIGS